MIDWKLVHTSIVYLYRLKYEYFFSELYIELLL